MKFTSLVGIAAVVLALSASSRAYADTLVDWDFQNVRTVDRVSVSEGYSSDPSIWGIVSQSGGGPAEDWGDQVAFLTRFLGTYHPFILLETTETLYLEDLTFQHSYHPFILLETTETLYLEDLTFQHWHNHNPGFPTDPNYSVQLQLDGGDGFFDIGEPLLLDNDNSGSTATIAIGITLPPGIYLIRWDPRGLAYGSDTNTEFFALTDLQLNGALGE
jgi:hypothetical protein